MLLVNKHAEITALYLAFDSTPHPKTGKPETQNYMLPNIDLDLFYTPAIRAVAQRALFLTKNRGDPPSWYSLVNDPSIDEEYRQSLKRFEPEKSYSKKQCKEVLELLVQFKNMRILHSIEEEINQNLDSSSVDVERLKNAVQDLLSRINNNSRDVQELHHFGKHTNARNLIIAETKRTKPDLIPTHFEAFDEVNGGLPSSGLFIFAAYTSSLKSAMLNQVLMNMYLKGNISVAKASLEMGEDQELRRIICSMGGIDLQKVTQVKMTEQDKKHFIKTGDKFIQHGVDNNCLFTIYSPKSEVELIELLTRLKPFGHKVIGIDYVTLLKDADENEQWKALGRIARLCKLYGESTNKLIILLAQLSEENKIRYSAAMKEHADGVWTWSVSDADREAGEFDIKQVKGRDQQLLTFRCQIDFKSLCITSRSVARELSEEDVDVKAFSADEEDDEEELLQRFS